MELRKVVIQVEDVHIEGGRPIDTPVRTAIAAAVLTNPWAGRGYVADLSPEIERVAPLLAEELVPRVRDAMGGAEGIEAFGKAAVVGVNGEIEHASALIHTLRFGNRFRDMAEGQSFLSFSNTRGVAGTLVHVPMVHKNDRSQRTHFITGLIQIPDAPLADEIMVIIGATSSGRPFARIGHRDLDVQIGAV
jgi:hypothetical protein